MPTASYHSFYPAIEIMLEGGNLGSETWSLKLGTAVNQSAGTFTETTSAGGYTTGGVSLGTPTSATQSGGVYKLVLPDPSSPTWTGTGSGFTFQYVILVGSVSGNVAYWDYGSSQAVAAGETVTVDLDQTNGVLQIASPA